MRSPERGGLARRAGTLAALRADGPCLAIELGGTLSGSAPAIASGGRLPLELLAAGSYDAVVLTAGDLALPDLDELVRGPVPLLSANVYREGKRVASPLVVRGDIAVVGLTDVPPPGTGPPGFEIRDPVAELAAIAAQSPAARLVVATDMGPLEARRLAAELVICRGGGITGDGVRARGEGRFLVTVAPAGIDVPVLSPGAPPQLSRLTVTAEAPAAARAVLERFGVLAAPPAAAAAATPLPSPLPALDHTVWLWQHGTSRAVTLTVHGGSLTRRLGERAAPRDGAFLVLDVEWRNDIPLTLVYEQLASTAYRIPRLFDHVYAVADGKRLLRLHPDAASIPGHLPVNDFTLPYLGSTRRGSLVFVAEQMPALSLELRLYDYAHGHVIVPLFGPTEPAEPPLAGKQSNEVLEMGVFALERGAERGGQQAPAGFELVAVDVRARSRFTIEGDAGAFDPQAPKGSKIAVGTVADWKESRRYLQLVVDGEHAYAPLAESTLPAEPRFLPDVMTGGYLVFVVPVTGRSLELRCDFPNARSSAGDAFRPAGITLLLAGARPEVPDRPALASVDDDVFRVAVVAQSTSSTIGDAKAGPKERFLLSTVTVRNIGSRGEFFQSRAQLGVALASGAVVRYDPASAQLAHPPLELLWIPAGERRTFDLAYRVPASETKPRLAYAGVSLQKTLELPPLPPAEIVGARPPEVPVAPPPPPVRPPDRPVQPPPDRPVQPPPDRAVPPAKATTEPSDTALPPPPPAKGLAGVGLTAEQVNAAIDRGADGLWNHVREKDLRRTYPLGHYPEHILVALALVHAGAHRRLPELDAALKQLLTRVEPQKLPVYELGLLCMLVEAYGDPSFVPKLRGAARALLEGQGKEGSWNYRTGLEHEPVPDPEADQVLAVFGGEPPSGEPGEPTWQRLTNKGTDGDCSVTQFALLGLSSASRAGVPLPRGLWEASLRRHLTWQVEDGSWPYNGGWSGYGSMTCAGICALLICRHELGEKDPADLPAIRRGLMWLANRFSVDKNIGYDGWDFYYLYALERVGRLLDSEFIGANEWYPIGARHLVDAQRPDGLWLGRKSTERDDLRLPSSFALLFLTRATSSLKTERKRGGDGWLHAGIGLPPELRVHFVLDGSGSMLDEMEGEAKFEVARRAVANLVAALPDSCEVGLRVYGHRKRAIEPGAEEDTALEMPLRTLDRDAFAKKLASLRARGKTPLARSLVDAVRDVGRVDAERPVLLVVLTDGGDDTRGRTDMAKAADEIKKRSGIRLRVVGFDIDREDWTTQLQTLCQRADGLYLPARRAADLGVELRSAVLGMPAGFVVRGLDGKEVARGHFGDRLRLPEGKYRVATEFGGRAYEREVRINTDATTGVVFDASKIKP